MTLFLGNTLLDAAPSTGGVVPVIMSDGSIRGMTIPAAAAALMEGRGTDTVSEKTAGAGVTVDGVLLKDGGVSLSNGSLQISRGTITGQVAIGLGAVPSEGWMVSTIEETISHVDNAELSIALTGGVIPAQSVILAVQANVAAALTGGGTTVKVGVGISSDPDKYGLSSALTKNTKINTIPAYSVLSSPETVGVYACATGGAAGDTALTVGSVRVRLIYATLVNLADAP